MINRQPSELPEHNDGHERNRQPPIVLRRQKNPRCSLSNTAQFGSDADSAPVPPSAALKNRDLPDESLTYSECRVKELLIDSVQKRKRRLFAPAVVVRNQRIAVPFGILRWRNFLCWRYLFA